MTKSRVFLLVATLILLLIAVFLRLTFKSSENGRVYKGATLVAGETVDAFWRSEHWL